MSDKITSLPRLKDILASLKVEGKKIVFTNGCFDILHLGHIKYLRKAKALGDILVVGLNTDSSVRKIKGSLRPIVPEDERAEILAALEMVDYVVMFSRETPEKIILELQPDIHVKGGDYTEEMLPEAKLVRSYGGKVAIIPLVEGKATTNIIREILDRYGNPE
ncbi:MAG: D-glycero-beta-D-manno-heptose 1-phosphate adenylyltransferase [Candidatus Eremiobacteraeota bacterium]|nr:D-glycero-beta-D-manno-heptose 1-phosphate adenylyltransferase [Candidatus Eremiobacteraeota bacterium]